VSPWARVQHRLDGEVPIVAIEGEIDIANITELRNTILRHVPNTVAGLVLDLSPTTYLDSQGIHLLLDLADRLRNRRIRFAVVSPPASFVRRILELSQAQTIVSTETDVATAVANILA
jgi:anti-sigma B factor antagonist